VSLGTVAGVPAGALVSEFWGWRLAFAVSAMMAVAAFVAVAVLVPPLPAKSGGGLDDLKLASRSGVVQFGLAGTVLSFVGHTYVTPCLLQIVRIDALTVSAVLFGFGLAGVAGNLLGGWAVGKSVYCALVGTLVVFGITVLLLTLTGSYPTVAIPLVVLWGLGFGMQPIVTQSWMFNAA